MKTLNIPFIEGLESLSEENLTQKLKDFGAKGKVDIAPWAEFSHRPDVCFDIAASSSHIFVQFHVKGEGLKADFSHTNEPVWQDSCVEFFVEDSDGGGYRNFEVNCIGTLLSSHQKAKGVDTCRISEEDASKVIRLTSLEKVPFSEKSGLHAWSVAIGIPFALLGYENKPEKLRANFYKCADGTKHPHYLCWSPIDTPKPNFHRPEFFGTLLLD